MRSVMMDQKSLFLNCIDWLLLLRKSLSACGNAAMQPSIPAPKLRLLNADRIGVMHYESCIL